MNVGITHHNPNVLTGTIPINGTLTHEIDLMGFTTIGLWYTGATNGTLSFQVAEKPDIQGGTFVDLLAANGAAVTFGPSGAAGAVSGLVMEALAPYRYVKIKTSIAQATAVTFKLPVKA